MKKLISTIIFMLSIFLLSACTPERGFDQNRIISPEPTNLSISGIWKVENKQSTNKEESIDKQSKDRNIDIDTISISKNLIIFGNKRIEHPKFKLKRIQKNTIIDENFEKKIFNENNKQDDYVDIISIYDNNKTYFNFIKSEGGKSYIYTNKNILELKKIADEVNNDSNNRSLEVIQNETDVPLINDRYYKMDVGVVLGLKKTSEINSKESKYRTLWISLKDGSIQPIEELDNILLVPRANGGFSKIKLEYNKESKDREEILTVTSKRKGEEENKSLLKETGIHKDITFVGNDYIGLQYYDGNNFNNQYNKYKIIPVDSVNVSDSIDLISLFGESSKESYEKAKQKVVETSKSSSLKEFNFTENDYRNITLIRKNGLWALEGRINLNNSQEKYVSFPIDVPSIKVLVKYDGTIFPWNKLKEFNTNIRDSICAPNGRFIVTLEGEKLKVYEVSKSGKIEKEIAEISIDENETIVMSEWATGEFVSQWTNIIKNLEKRKE